MHPLKVAPFGAHQEREIYVVRRETGLEVDVCCLDAFEISMTLSGHRSAYSSPAAAHQFHGHPVAEIQGFEKRPSRNPRKIGAVVDKSRFWSGFCASLHISDDTCSYRLVTAKNYESVAKV
jgi:hypothetical protein